MQSNKNKKIGYLDILFLIIPFAIVVFCLSRPTYEDKQTCLLKSLAVKDVITGIQPGHEVTFTISHIDQYFQMSFANKADPKDEVIDIQPGEIYVTPIKGDSILKAANSDTVTFKRDKKKFLKYLAHKTCD